MLQRKKIYTVMAEIRYFLRPLTEYVQLHKIWNTEIHIRTFYILLTVHHVMILGKWPTWCTNSFSMYLFIFLTLYMFRAQHVHHQDRQIVSIQPLVTLTVCWGPCRVQVGSLLPTYTRHGHQHRVTVTRSCIDTICLSWWWAQCARNM